MSTIEVTDAGAGIPPPLAEEWDRLGERAGASPFVRPGWTTAWWRSFGRGRLEVLQLRRGGELAAVLPLQCAGSRLSSPTNAHTPSFEIVSEDPDAGRELLGEALRRPSTRFSLTHLGADGVAGVEEAAAAAGRPATSSEIGRSPYVDTTGPRNEYEARLSSKLRREIRRRRRRLEAEGPVSLDVTRGGARLEDLLSEGLALEGAAWKASAGTAIGSSAETERFYREVARWAAEVDILRLAFLRVGERAIAFDLCLEANGLHYLLKTGFDPAAREFGPGVMMRWEMISRAFAAGLVSYEFLGRDEAWKLRWTEDTRPRLAAEAYGRSAAGRASRIWRERLRPLAKRALRRGP